MNDQSIIKSQLRLKEATLSEIAEVTSKLFFQNEILRFYVFPIF